MLVVCYTNHALDQFLAGLKPATDSIVRVGGGCKDPRVEQHSINALRRKGCHRCPPELYKNIQQEKYKFNVIKSLGENIRNCSSLLKMGLISIHTFFSFGIGPYQFKHLKDDDIFEWLCGFRVDEIIRHTGLLSENIIDPADSSFGLLQVRSMGKITLSFSFRVLEETLSKQGQERTPSKDLLDRLERLKQNLTIEPFPCRPWHQRQPPDIWRLDTNERWQLYR